jgi:hypothetical protein
MSKLNYTLSAPTPMPKPHDGLIMVQLHVRVQGDWQNSDEGTRELRAVERAVLDLRKHFAPDKDDGPLADIYPTIIGDLLIVNVACPERATAETARRLLDETCKRLKMADASQSVGRQS